MRNIGEQISEIEEVLSDTPREYKVIRRDKGLIERTESSRIIITEEDKRLLMD